MFSKAYLSYGLIDRPFNLSGVPSIIKKYRVIGFEKELNQLIKALEIFLRGSDNLLLVVVGQYGCGKTELLELFEENVKTKYDVDILRLSLTFNLNIDTVLNVINNRVNDRPLVLLIDEADEISRLNVISAFSSSEEFRRLIISLGTLIRALLEPKNYKDVLKIKVEKFSKILIIIALTPQLYYSVFKNIVPDVFDITRGRVFKEIIIDDRVPLWLFEAIVQERLQSYSTSTRLEMINKGEVDDLYPLRFEYLAMLYTLISIIERGKPSLRALIKLVGKLLDDVVAKGEELNWRIFREFLEQEVKSGELKINLDVINQLSNSEIEHVLNAIALSGVPRTLNSLMMELKHDPTKHLEVLKSLDIIEEVKIVELDSEDKITLRKINNDRLNLGLPPINVEDLRELSHHYGNYYTRFRNGKTRLYVIFPESYDGGFKAYQLKSQLYAQIVSIKDLEIYDKVKNIIARISKIVETESSELFKEIGKVIFEREISLIPHGKVSIAVTSSESDVRLGFMACKVNSQEELNGVLKMLNEVINEGVLIVNGIERPIDALILVLVSNYFSKDYLDEKLSILLEKPWKTIHDKARNYILTIIYTSENLNDLKSIISGYYLENSLERIPKEYEAVIASYRRFRELIGIFRDKVRNSILKLTIGLRRGKETKHQVIRKIVHAWINSEKIPEQPEVFRDNEGYAKISLIEEIMHKYLTTHHNGKELSIKEIEHYVRKIFPTHLWRDFKEHDLIFLMKLRGLLLPADKLFSKFYPFNSRNVEKSLNVIDEVLNSLEKKFKIEKMKLKVKKLNVDVEVLPDVNLDLEIHRCKGMCRELMALPPSSSDYLKNLSKLLLQVYDLVDLVENTKIELNAKIAEIETKINGWINNVFSRIEIIEEKMKELPEKIRQELLEKLNTLTAHVKNCIVKVNDLKLSSIDKVFNSLTIEVENKLKEFEEIVELIKQVLRQYSEIELICQALHKVHEILGNEYPEKCKLDFIIDDLLIIMKSGKTQYLQEYVIKISDKLLSLKSELSDFMIKLSRVVHDYENARKWIINRLSKMDMKVCEDLKNELSLTSTDLKSIIDNLSRIENAKKVIDNILNTISNKFRVENTLIRRIAFMGYNVGIDVDELSIDLGLDKEILIKRLEDMCRYGLIEKKYVT